MPTHAGPYPLFLVEPNGQQRQYARRYTPFEDDKDCPEHPGLCSHSAAVCLGDAPDDSNLAGREATEAERTTLPFPTVCACGYEFGPDDVWQILMHTVYEVREVMPGAAVQVGDLFVSRDLPVGACYHASWMGGGSHQRGPDGLYLVVVCPRTPDGEGTAEWHVDAEASNGPGWTRTGTVPRVTARPSIFIDAPRGWHGWLRDGVLVPV